MSGELNGVGKAAGKQKGALQLGDTEEFMYEGAESLVGFTRRTCLNPRSRGQSHTCQCFLVFAESTAL